MTNDSNTPARRQLSDILNGGTDILRSAWESTKAAEDFAPLPSGSYECRLMAGELFKSKSGTPGYKLTFSVIDGEHAGRRFWDDLWLTPAALPMAKRDLAKLGVTTLEQLEQPVPEGIVCQVKVTQRRSDDGTTFNRIKAFDVLRIETPEPEPFAPAELGDLQSEISNDADGTFPPKETEGEL